MPDDSSGDEWSFRAMIEDKGKPQLGSTALTLGIRPGHDIDVDANVWKIRRSDLEADLEAQQDGPRHVSIGPAKSMPLADYVAAIEHTAPHWVKVT